MDLRKYQELASKTDRSRGEVMIALLGLAGEAGEVVSEYKKFLRDGAAYTALRQRMEEELGDVLWYVALTATHFSLSLDEIAMRNLAKVEARWTATTGQLALRSSFDTDFPSAERLPRRLGVRIETVGDSRHAAIRILDTDEQIGQTLTDNAYSPDGYRFHDVFHLAYMAVLGWSPVMRKLLGRKRKTDARIDEVEDGGRAIAVEEAISAIVFDYAKQHNFLDGIDEIDHSLLRTVKSMTSHLEVAARGVADWEAAILTGYSAWRALCAEHNVVLSLDLDSRSLTVVRE